ncbi:lipopolysaccharide assembly protein LapA domain-containing protein [Pseudomonas sp. Gutcm_11s]|uniref:lipopolysaccharide assembly protein LapA domain-containing protein n=1 Tax=Pseudomonas sp. Gutcm_11s TaxID=3026088 RepID=UPI00235DE899|nr:lipopolysaccharide assembly protein LapA domain-containing protein [Pseudomonas sp. Gutcm_11s]MDD0843123.1 lipopolysaccharide assembly protein LapA domain-containing protein [Pseudomonas sp. Gutcm_11s]
MLNGIRRLIWLGALVLVGMIILALMLQNPQRSQFHFLFWVTPELPFSIFLIMAFVLGLLGALLLSLWASARRAIGIKANKAD